MREKEIVERMEAVLDRLLKEERTVFAWSAVKEELERIRKEMGV